MSEDHSRFEREVRDTVIKSGMTGIAATAIAISVFSPAGFGDWIGASVAWSFGIDLTASAEDNAYANLPAYPTPMTRDELNDIQSQLAAGEASMAIIRAATDGNIEQVRSIATGSGFGCRFGRLSPFCRRQICASHLASQFRTRPATKRRWKHTSLRRLLRKMRATARP